MKNKLLSQLYESCKKWKTLVLLGAMLLIGMNSAWAGTRTIYFDTGGFSFKESATNFAVYLWNEGGTNEWVAMSLVSGTVYSATIPDTREKCIFCAVDSYGATGWDHRKAQTDDQTLSAKDLYTVTSSNKDNGDIRGSWSTYGGGGGGGSSATYTVAGSSSVLGSNWDQTDTNNDMVDDGEGTFTLTKSNVTLSAGNIECKVVMNHSWDNSWPTNNLVTNIESAGTYDVTYTFVESTKAVSVVATPVVSNYTVTYEVGTSYTTMGSLGAYDNTSSSAVGASPATVARAHSVTFTATPNEYYEVEGWYTNAACTSGKHDAGSTTYTVASLSSDLNVYVKFKLIDYTITYKDQGNVAYSGNNSGSLIASYNYGTGVSTLVDGSKNGYTFVGWYADSGCTGSKVTSISNTASGNKTFYAKWTENMTTVTINVSPAGAGTLTVASSSFTPGNTTTAGVSTGRSVSASANSGYTFVGWKTEGNASGSSSTASITLKGNGSAGTGTLTAVFSKNVSSGWYLVGELFTASDNWHNTNYPLNASYRGISNIAYRVVNFNRTNNKYFKLYHNSRQYGQNSGNDQAVVTGTQYAFMDKDGAEKAAFKTNGQGTVWCVADYGNNKFWVQNPKLYFPVTISNGSSGTNLVGTEGTIALTTNNLGNLATLYYEVGERINISVTAKTGYWIDDISINGTSLVENRNSASWSGYTNMPSSDAVLTVTYNRIYTLNYYIGSVKGTDGSISTRPSTASGSKVLSGTNVTLTAPAAKTGYTWKGWYANTAGTGDKLCSTKAYAITISGNTTVYACYTINNHSITHSAATNGSYTIKVGDASAVSTNTTSDYGETITLAATASDGYHFGSWTVTKSPSGSVTPSPNASTTPATFSMPDNNVTVSASFVANSYTVTFNKNGGSGDDMASESFTYGTSKTLTANTYTRTGYTFQGWATSAEGDVAFADEASGHLMVTANGATVELFAVWSAKTYTVNLDYDETGKGSDGANSSVTATYDASMPDMGTAPVGAAGYKFRGYFTEQSGGGDQYYDANGTSLRTWDINADPSTLYAYFEKAEIATLPLSVSVVHPWVSSGTMDSIDVTPTLTFTPEPTVVICYEIQYSDGASVSDDGLQEFRNLGGNNIRFRAPKNPGSYRVHAMLKQDDCDGDILDTEDEVFVVTASHNVTVKYVCEGKTLKESEVMSINALDSVEITAPTIEFYTFSGWEMTTGITSSSASSVNPKKFVATYDGIITVKYVETPIVYFYNNLGWEDVYVTYDANWIEGQGTGNNGKWYNHMTRIEGTDIWYDAVPAYYINNGFEHWAPTIAFNDEMIASELGYKAFNADNCRQTSFTRGKVVYRRDFDRQTMMFVPTPSDSYTQNGATYYSSRVSYYEHNDKGIHVNLHTTGYWKRYNSTYSGYSLRGEFNSWAGSNHNFVSENEDDSIFSTTVKLDKGAYYYFRVYRNTVGRDNEGFLTYYNESTPITLARSIADETDTIQFNRNADIFNYNCKMRAATEGEYKFSVYFKYDGTVWVTVDYPMHAGDYQALYKDNVHTAWHPAGTIDADATKNITSFFVRKKKSPVVKWRKASSIGDDGTIEWGDLNSVDISSYQEPGEVIDDDATGVDTTGVYNFKFNIADNALSLTDIEEYTGPYYIRTNSANKWKWEHYTDGEHTMTYSDYADTHSGYSHYFMKFVGNGTNVKFTVANDYSPCISDTLGQGTQSNFVNGYDNLIADANIRYSWNMHDNSLNRAYVGKVDRTHKPRQATKFIVLQGQDGYIMDKDENELNETNQGTMFVGDDAIEFDDDENWIYETTVKAKADGRIKIYSHINNNNYYLLGGAPLPGEGEGAWESSNSDFLITGTNPDELQTIRVIYDFKTNRLMAGWVPAGTIDKDMTLKADILIRRTHQGEAEQFSIADGKTIQLDSETNKTVYGVMRFNKYELNNLNSDGTPKAVQLPPAELQNFYISFPFDVKVSDIFGFGSYGPEWTLRYYDGKSRAKKGFWADTPSFWKWVAPNGTLNANEGYLLSLNMSKFGTDAAVWNNGVTNIELYFPATGTINIKKVSEFDIAALSDAEYKCTINRGEGTDGDRRVKDSYWRCIGVPSFAYYDANYNAGSGAINWQTSGEALPFLYQVNWNTNDLIPVSESTFRFQPMHAYMVQNGNLIRWTNVVKPYLAPRKSELKEVTFRLELSKNDVQEDQAFIRLTDKENVTTGFDFNQDLSKEFNTVANIYTMIGYERAAANSLPLTEQTVIVPVGVKVAADGDYTFAMPDGTNGIGVTLIDNETGIRTSLSALDYTINLSAGQYEDRFVIEISPIMQTPTGIEEVAGEGAQGIGVRKLLIDGILYIVRDGKIFDAQGKRVK